MRRWLACLAALCISGPAGAAYNRAESIMPSTEVATGAPVSATLENNQHNVAGYLIVKTEDKNNSASLVVTILNVTPSGNFLVCTSTAITTETTTVIMLGSGAAADEGITDVCPFPIGLGVAFTFTTTGASADFDVTASIEWLAMTSVGGGGSPGGSDTNVQYNDSGALAGSSNLTFTDVADHEWTTPVADVTVGNGTEGMIKIGSVFLGQADETIAGVVHDGVFYIVNPTSTVSDLAAVFIDETGVARLAIPVAGNDLAAWFPRSVVVGPAATMATMDEGIHCNDAPSSLNFSHIDCDTDGSGADLGVQDDIEALGSIYSSETVQAEHLYSTDDLQVDGDGVVTGALSAASLDLDAVAAPAAVLKDSDAPGTDKDIGWFSGQYVDGGDGSENSDIFLGIIEAGGENTVKLSFDQSDSRWEVPTGEGLAFGTTQWDDGADKIRGGALGVTFTKCHTHGDVTGAPLSDGDHHDNYWRAPADVTVTEIWCITDAGTFTMNVENVSTDIMGSDLICDTDGEVDSSPGGDATVADGATLSMKATELSGTPRTLTWCFEHTRD